MYNTDDNTTPTTTDTERLAALQAEVTHLTGKCDRWREQHSSAVNRTTDLTDAVQALADEQADFDEDRLDSDAWSTMFDTWGIKDPRRVDVTITLSATLTQTAEVVITLTGVKRSEVDDIAVEFDGVTELGNRRDWSQYATVGVDYENMEIEVTNFDSFNGVDDQSVSTD